LTVQVQERRAGQAMLPLLAPLTGLVPG